MAAANYAACLAKVLRYEGGYVNDPHDPGGETNYGITIAVARANGYTGAMHAIPMELVRKIYKTKYWDAVQGDALPVGLDLAVFDFAVNSGVSRAKNMLAAIGPQGGSMERVDRYCDARLRFLKGLKIWARYGKGWASRVNDVRQTARAMALTPAPAEKPFSGAPNYEGQAPGAAPGPGFTPIALPPPAAKPEPTKKRDGIAAMILAFIVAAAAAAYTWAMEHLPEIFLGVIVALVLALLLYRWKKGHWPWTSHHSPGNPLPATLPNMHPSSAPSSDHLSGLLAALRDPSSGAPSPVLSEPSQHPTRSARSSRQTRLRGKGSRSSSKSKRTRSSRSAKSRSKR